MRRRFVSDKELRQIVKFKQAGASWLMIQQRTGVPRRSAKKAYEDWQQNQSMEELKAARVNVAGELFREHLNSLIKLARFLADHLTIPSSSIDTRKADTFLSGLWETDIIGQLEPQRPSERDSRERGHIARQNQMLFTSLQEHTREKVRWQVFDEWRQAWDNCVQVSAELHKAAREVLGNFLNQDRGLLNRVKVGSKEDAMKRMVEGVLHLIWTSILADEPGGVFPLAEAVQRPDGTVDVVFGEGHLSLYLIFTQADPAGQAARICNGAVKNLCIGEKKGMVEMLASDIRQMKRAIEELDEMLNALVLRSMIVRTRCELCPA
jgi:hypothetical protein